jgi:hypothetical protein
VLILLRASLRVRTLPAASWVCVVEPLSGLFCAVRLPRPSRVELVARFLGSVMVVGRSWPS